MKKYKIGLFSLGQTLVTLGTKILGEAVDTVMQIGSIVMIVVGAGIAGLAVYLIVKQEVERGIEYLVRKYLIGEE